MTQTAAARSRAAKRRSRSRTFRAPYTCPRRAARMPASRWANARQPRLDRRARRPSPPPRSCSRRWLGFRLRCRCRSLRSRAGGIRYPSSAPGTARSVGWTYTAHGRCDDLLEHGRPSDRADGANHRHRTSSVRQRAISEIAFAAKPTDLPARASTSRRRRRSWRPQLAWLCRRRVCRQRSPTALSVVDHGHRPEHLHRFRGESEATEVQVTYTRQYRWSASADPGADRRARPPSVDEARHHVAIGAADLHLRARCRAPGSIRRWCAA